MAPGRPEARSDAAISLFVSRRCRDCAESCGFHIKLARRSIRLFSADRAASATTLRRRVDDGQAACSFSRMIAAQHHRFRPGHAACTTFRTRRRRADYSVTADFSCCREWHAAPRRRVDFFHIGFSAHARSPKPLPPRPVQKEAPRCPARARGMLAGDGSRYAQGLYRWLTVA